MIEVGQAQCATPEEVGQAEAHKAALIFAINPDNAAPPWLSGLLEKVDKLTTDVATMQKTLDRMETKVDKIQETSQQLVQAGKELPILLANGNAGPRGPLLDPTQVVDGFAPPLLAPNPTTRDQLRGFSGMSA